MTEDFWNLIESSRGCTNETFTKCTTERYVEKLMDKCGCLPLRMRPELLEVLMC